MTLPAADLAPVSEEELLARLEALVPELRARAAETESLRRMPDDLLQKIIATGYIGGFRPKRYGGLGLGLSALANGSRILAHGCASSAWTTVFLTQHAWMLGRLPMPLQEEMYANGNLPLIAGALARLGTAEAVEGGYRVSGRVDWNSAIHNSDWTSVKAPINGEVHIFYMPVKDVVLDNGWNVSGMRGTSSDAFEAKDVFVPANRVASSLLMARAEIPPEHPGEIFLTYPYLQTVAITCSSVVLGATEWAVDLFDERMRSRVLAFSGNLKQVDQPFAQMRLGEVTLRLAMAREIWDSCIRKLDALAGSGKALTYEDRISITGACTLVVHTCRDLVNHMMNSAGGTSYFLDSPLQRIQRDIEVLKSHAFFDWDRTAHLRGRIRLGIEPTPVDLF
jgi:alkylation response protein AidB-like acyl-CoA dehydrogenase